MPKETILVVDDSPELAHTIINLMLIPLGYTALYANDGRKGLEMATQQPCDLILTDMNMPRMSGLEMIRELRQTDCEAPVIFMTMHGSENVAIEAFRLGVRDYLIKPFTYNNLEQAVDNALQQVRLIHEKEALARNLLVSDTIRQTVVTLAHHINNSLMVVQAGLSLIDEEQYKPIPNTELVAKILKESQRDAVKIGAVLQVLQKITHPSYTTYHGNVDMIDIEEALAKAIEEF